MNTTSSSFFASLLAALLVVVAVNLLFFVYANRYLLFSIPGSALIASILMVLIYKNSRHD